MVVSALPSEQRAEKIDAQNGRPSSVYASALLNGQRRQQADAIRFNVCGSVTLSVIILVSPERLKLEISNFVCI